MVFDTLSIRGDFVEGVFIEILNFMNKDDYNFKLCVLCIYYLFQVIFYSFTALNEHSASPVVHFSRRAKSKNTEDKEIVAAGTGFSHVFVRREGEEGVELDSSLSLRVNNFVTFS